MTTIHMRCNAGRGRRLAVTAVLLGGMCAGQSWGQLLCRDATATELARKLAGRHERTTADSLDIQGRQCAGSGYTLLAAQLFDAGRLAEASRSASAAIRLLEMEPVNPGLLLGALRMQAAMYVERGMLNESLTVIDRLKAMRASSPEADAIIHGLAGAHHQAAGEAGAAEREYLLAIGSWNSMQRGEDLLSELSNLGVLYISARRFDEAIVMLERANTLLARSGNKAAYHNLVITNNLAVAYSERGQTSKAVRYARSALDLIETARTHGSQLAANVYFNAAGVLRAAGRRKEANDLEARGAMAQTMANAVVDVQTLTVQERRQ